MRYGEEEGDFGVYCRMNYSKGSGYGGRRNDYDDFHFGGCSVYAGEPFQEEA